MKIDVLFLHHASDPVTQYHYETLVELNKHDESVRIVPIGFGEYLPNLLPGSYVPKVPEAFRTNPSAHFYRFYYAQGPLLYDLDCLIWDYVMYSGEKADRIVITEGDMLSRCSIREFFGPSFRHAITGSVVRTRLEDHPDWIWFHRTPEIQRTLLGRNMASISPVCGIQMSWEIAEKMARLVFRSGGLFDNMHIELAIATLAQMVGEEPRETELPGDFKPLDFISSQKEDVQIGPWGLFHPVKQIIPAPVYTTPDPVVYYRKAHKSAPPAAGENTP